MIHRAFVFVLLGLTPMATLAQPPAPLPEGAIARLGNQRFSAPWGVGIALSPDGMRLACAKGSSQGKPGSIIVWDVNTAKVVHETQPGDIFEQSWGIALAWSANGKAMATTTQSRFQVWDVETGQRHTPDKKPQIGFDLQIRDFRFVAGDRQLAFVGRKYDRTGGRFVVELWDVASGTRFALWTPDKSKWDPLPDGHDIRNVALSPSGEHMAWLAGPALDAKDGKCTVFVYETTTQKLLHTVSDLPRAYRVDLPDEGQTLLLHPLRTERVERITTGQAAVVRIADGKVRFHCAYRFAPAAYMHSSESKPQPGYVTIGAINAAAIRFHDTLVIPDEIGLTRWDLKTGQKLDEFNEPFESFAVSANGQRLAVRNERRIGTTAGMLADLRNPGVFARAATVRYLPDGRLLASDRNYRGGLVHVWDPRKRILLETIRVFGRPESSGVVLGSNRHDGWGKTTVATLGNYEKQNLVTYDLLANQVLSVVKGLNRAQLSGDGKRLLTNEFDDKRYRLIVRWFDSRTGQELGRHDIPYKQMHQSLANTARDAEWLAENGSAFGYIDVKGRLAVVDCVERKVIMTPGITPAKDWHDPVWQPQSAGFDRLLWIAPRFYDIYSGVNHNNKDAAEYAVWDRQGRLLRRFAVPARRLWMGNEILSPDGRTMAVGSDGKTIILYETASGRPRGQIESAFPYGLFYDSHPDLRLADFSPDATMLATTCITTSSVLLWDLARPLGDERPLPTPESTKECERLWDSLGHPNPVESDRALWALVAAPKYALAFLEKRLRPRPELDDKRLDALIRQMKSAVFVERAAASKELLGAKETALPALRAARKVSASLEEARRIDQVIGELQARLDTPSAVLSELRALEVLERIGTPEARKHIEAMAKGADAVPTYEAQLILSRWRTSF